MKKTRLFSMAFLFILGGFVYSDLYAQSSEDLIGRWEGVHYYGDTTRLYDGTLNIRSSTIDSMKMNLVIEQFQEGKFKGKLHEHFYSDPKSFFTADVSGFIKDETIHFSSFDVKENKMPQGNRWCNPKATGVLVKSEKLFFLNMSFESTLICTIGPAMLEKKILENITKTPAELPTLLKDSVVNIQPPVPQNQDSFAITKKFKTRNRSGNTTINVQSDSIRINFVDNGTVDGDSISVFINGNLAAAHVRLTASVFTMSVKFENGTDEIEVAMFAENLGSLPPNTALMQILDGKKIHQAYLSSDTTSNAVIKLKKVKSLK